MQPSVIFLSSHRIFSSVMPSFAFVAAEYLNPRHHRLPLNDNCESMNRYSLDRIIGFLVSQSTLVPVFSTSHLRTYVHIESSVIVDILLPICRSNTDYPKARICKPFKEPRNRFQGSTSASLCSLAGWYDNHIPAKFLAPTDCFKADAE